jgi:hypothetical protein
MGMRPVLAIDDVMYSHRCSHAWGVPEPPPDGASDIVLHG